MHFDDSESWHVGSDTDLFSVALYKPKQGDYWMDEDDTAVHWREKSIMKAILDREDIPAIRSYVADKAAALLSAAGGSIDAVMGLTRAVLVNASCHGRDNSVIVDAIAQSNGRYRGVANADASFTEAEFQTLHAQGFRGVRFNFVKHLGGVPDMSPRLVDGAAPCCGRTRMLTRSVVFGSAGPIGAAPGTSLCSEWGIAYVVAEF